MNPRNTEPKNSESRRRNMPPEEFSSRMSRGEMIAVLVYLPLHVWLVPTVLQMIPAAQGLSVATVNLIAYVFAAGYMLAAAWRFLRRDFDPLCDHLSFCIAEVLISYGMMLAFNLILNGIFSLLQTGENPNNMMVYDLANFEYGKIAAAAMFLGPIVEELMFRAGIFSLLRDRSRVLAYAVSMLLFALYHIWSYALQDPVYWLYLVQYLPVSWLLCRCYGRCNSIWGSIFLHMVINGVTMSTWQAMAGM